MVLTILVTLALIVITLTAILNTLLFPRLKKESVPAATPFVSILIPARNEAQVIEQAVRSLLGQHYHHFELIILDDNSEDGTANLARAAGRGDPRLRVVRGAPLPPGWSGKSWACWQLSELAQGEWLLFTDADVQWTPAALGAVVAQAGDSGADLLTVWPTQINRTMSERLVVPLMALAIFGYLPLPAVHHLPWPVFAAANGQCMLFRRRAYRAIAGHASVRETVLDDVGLARRIKAAGFRLRMTDGNDLIRCRMYGDWLGVRDGFAKNILAGYGNSIPGLLLATVFHWLIFLMPWFWLGLGWVNGGTDGWPWWPLILVGLGVGARALSAAATRQRLGDALLMPISAMLMTHIAVQALWWQWRYGGPRWKGRTLTRGHNRAGEPLTVGGSRHD